MTFILDSLKEKFGNEEKYSSEGGEGFPDMNYIIGNSSAMDIGEVPTPMDERIGYASQIGGEVMELQITNPATFSLERDQMINVIKQLGIDVTLHSDMNAGYTTAYKSGQQYGYDTVENYFTKYLQELAQFKHEVQKLGEGNQPLFEIGRINPHISTSPLPELSERMAQDVSVDPFGFQVDEYNEEYRRMREKENQNIWANKDFMRTLYKTFLKQLVDQDWQLFTGRQGLFTDYSDKFDRIYRDTMRQACDSFYDEEVKSADDSLQAQVSLVSTAARADVGVQNAWLNKIDQPLEEDSVEIPILESTGDDDNPLRDNTLEINKLSEINQLLPPNVRLTRINGLAEAIYNIRNENWELRGRQVQLQMEEGDTASKELKEIAEKQIEKKLNDIWKGRNGEKEDKFLITVQGKLRALANNMDVEVDRIRNRALKEDGVDFENPSEGPWKIDEAAQEVMAGNKEFFIEGEEEKRYNQFLRALLGNFGREMWKESNMFYFVMPAWMSESDKEYDNHPGWEAPKFIWETIVESKYDLDLSNPLKEGGYFDMLQNNREFQMDVAAAVGACYAWAHFTQRKVNFNLNGRDFGLNNNEEEEVKSDGWTWIEWMNRFGIGVNFETMAGDPQQQFKIWRPKDIAVTAHAINMTTRKMLEENGELGGLNHINKELDGSPAKFTIDMEHVATMGVDPLGEMEIFIDQEKDLAENYSNLGIDKAKPLAKILRQMHLMDPGVEGQRGTHHGAFHRGNTLLYKWMYKFVENGFARNEEEPATILFELAEHKSESSYMMRIAMNLIEIGVTPDELDPNNVDPSKNEYEDEREALIARFFGMDKTTYDREWAKIEDHAFDPLDGLLEAEGFDFTWSGQGAIEEGGNRPQEWKQEEYK